MNLTDCKETKKHQEEIVQFILQTLVSFILLIVFCQNHKMLTLFHLLKLLIKHMFPPPQFLY